MFENTSRIESNNGIVFYEQDILFDNYNFSNDIKISFNAEYNSPGLGIALISNEGDALNDKKEAFLFRIGQNECSVIYNNQGIKKRLLVSSIDLSPYKENILFEFEKIGRNIKINISEIGTILNFTLPKRMDTFQYGLYSNAGNIVKDLNIASEVPYGWTINMSNTNGGYIFFNKNSFSILGCKHNAIIEQQNIFLKKGVYYLKYDKEKESDIESYVFLSNDKRYIDEEKNILKDNSFCLELDSFVNLKFKGTVGSIKNIHLTDNEKNPYTPTLENALNSEGSHIKIYKKNLSKAFWSGIIYMTPDDLDLIERESYSIISDSVKSIQMDELNILRGISYDYIYDAINNTITVLKEEQLINSFSLKQNIDYLTIFKNINASIHKFKIETLDGNTLDLILEQTSKKYIPGSITSPIIVLNDKDLPLDLSSSYRKIIGDIPRYIFTNYEREIFNSSKRISLTKKPSLEIGSILAYGILESAVINEANILSIENEGLDNIDLYTKDYEIIREQDFKDIDKENGVLLLEENDKYKFIIVDYLKKDSYAINFKEDIYMFEIDISSSDLNTKVIYDYVLDSTSLLTTIPDYKLIEEDIKTNSFVAIRRNIF